MDKFSKIEKKQNKENIPEESYRGKDISIVNYKKWDIIKGKDKVVILPYLKDEGYILLRYENIPTFQYKYKEIEGYRNVNNFITVIKGDILKNETPVQATRRILLEETGIVLNSNYPITVDKNLFKEEKNTGQYYISLLEINYNDFRQSPIKSEQTEDNRVIKLSVGEIDNLKTFDLITDYLLLKLRFDYNIK
jgi:8-oxo-dGTP pyrophosphatase MutT (NUDIX family)